jgi:hypothetical protein
MIITLHHTGETIPFAIFYCQKVVEDGDTLLIMMEDSDGTMNERIIGCDWYNIYENDDEEELVNIFKQFQSYLNEEVKGALKNDE